MAEFMQKRNKQKTVTSADAMIGNKIKSLRADLGKSQENLASALGITFQQVQKYENGATRITVGRLIDIANSLAVPLEYFFDELLLLSLHTENKNHEKLDRDALSVARAYLKIKDPVLKKGLMKLAKALSEN